MDDNMVNPNSNNIFQHYTSKENKHFQSELQNNGKRKAYLEAPHYMGKGAQDYKPHEKYHMSKRMFAVLASIAIAILAFVIVGTTVSYTRDAPSTATPATAQQQKPKKKKQKSVKKPQKKVHKIKRTIQKSKPVDNVVQVVQNHGTDVKAKPQNKSKAQKNHAKSLRPNATALKPRHQSGIDKTVQNQTKPRSQKD